MGEQSHGRASLSLRGYLILNMSTVGGAGIGLFADRNFTADNPIIMGTGEYVLKETQSAAARLYSFDIPGYDLLALQCSDDTRTNLIKYVNSNHHTQLPSNVQVFWHGPLPVLYATQDIAAGTELLMSYTF